MALARALAVDPQVLLLDEPFGALDAKVRTDLRQWLRRLHDEVHVTTVLVTHDQEEALDVADRIAVLNHGRIEQVGDPVTLYERPANDFVMGFLGSVAQLGGQLVRPHDIALERDRATALALDAKVADSPGVITATVERVVPLGFEVRVDLRADSGERFAAQITRRDAAELGLREGETIHARATGRSTVVGARSRARHLTPPKSSRVGTFHPSQAPLGFRSSSAHFPPEPPRSSSGHFPPRSSSGHFPLMASWVGAVALTVRQTACVDISARVDYAVRAMLILAEAESQGTGPVSIDTLATRQELPRKFLEAIFADLRRNDLVLSRRGARGGYVLGRAASEISVGDVFRAVDGPLAEVRGLRPHETAYQGVAEHLPSLWVAVRASLREVLDDTSLADLRTGELPARVKQLLTAPDAWKNR